ncbi:MAG: hypothetical protein M1831_003869 [Alyxoria varia]|nr:MAG: hypothetical protein M1831_003869 [Alyxoria varia]
MTFFFDSDCDDSDAESERDLKSPTDSVESLDRSAHSVSPVEILTPTAADEKHYLSSDVYRPRSARSPAGPKLLRRSLDQAKYEELKSQAEERRSKEDEWRSSTTSSTTRKTSIDTSVGHSQERDVRKWSTQQVAAWMYGSGFETPVISQFELHDINGPVLLDLQFEDLRELDISSFAKRRQIWNEVCALRVEGGYSPERTLFNNIERAYTPDVDFANERGREREQTHLPGFQDQPTLSPQDRRGSHHTITLRQSTSSTNIAIPKPHRCSKGERCSKWRKLQSMLEEVDQDHGPNTPPAEPEPNIMDTELRPISLRPFSETIPSVVASSDIFGPAAHDVPAFEPDAEMIRNLEMRRKEAQENVKQYLQMQNLQLHSAPDTPPSPIVDSPRMDRFPSNLDSQIGSPDFPPRNSSLQPLPRLAIPNLPASPLTPPRSASSTRTIARPPTPPRSASSSLIPRPLTPYSANQRFPSPLHLRSPASETDIPVTSPLPLFSRENSNSLPNDLQQRPQLIRGSASLDNIPKRRDFDKLPTLKESGGTIRYKNGARRVSKPLPATPRLSREVGGLGLSTDLPPVPPIPKRPPPSLPSSTPSLVPTTPKLKAPLTPNPGFKPAAAPPAFTNPLEKKYGCGTLSVGWVRRRRARLWRHEWQPVHVRLRGTTLAMHATADPEDKTPLETIDLDEHAVACSSAAGGNKFTAAMRTFKIGGGSEASIGNNTSASNSSFSSSSSAMRSEGDVFAWQLVPAANVAHVRSPSDITRANGPGNPIEQRAEATAAATATSTAPPRKGKTGEVLRTHHFAVKTRDERIEWMREVMLAKTLKQKAMLSRSGTSTKARTSVDGIHRTGSF